MISRRLSVLGTLISAIFFGLCTLFFAFVTVTAPIVDGWPGLIITALAGMPVWLVGWCAWMEFQTWWEDR